MIPEAVVIYTWHAGQKTKWNVKKDSWQESNTGLAQQLAKWCKQGTMIAFQITSYYRQCPLNKLCTKTSRHPIGWSTQLHIKCFCEAVTFWFLDCIREPALFSMNETLENLKSSTWHKLIRRTFPFGEKIQRELDATRPLGSGCSLWRVWSISGWCSGAKEQRADASGCNSEADQRSSIQPYWLAARHIEKVRCATKWIDWMGWMDLWVGWRIEHLWC